MTPLDRLLVFSTNHWLLLSLLPALGRSSGQFLWHLDVFP